MSNYEKLEACFRKALGFPPDAAVNRLSYQTDPTWDSLGHMRLVAEIETVFMIAMTTDEILDMNSFDVACAMLNKHGVVVNKP